MRIKTGFRLNNYVVFSVIWYIYIFTYYVLCSSELSYRYSTVSFFEKEQYGIILALLINIVFFNKYNNSVLMRYLGFATFAILMQLGSSSKTLLILTMFVMSVRKINFRKVIKVDMIARISVLIFIVGLYLAGVIDNYTDEINGTFKQALGFSHPNALGGMCYIILIEYVILKWQEIKPAHFFEVFFVGLGVMLISGSRTMGYTFFFIIMLFVLYRFSPKLFSLRLVKALFTLAMPSIYVACFIVVNMYNNRVPLAIKLNEILTTRVALASKFLKTYDIQLFGQDIQIIGTRYAALHHTTPMILDNAYIRGTLVYGLLFMIFLILSYMILMHHAFKNKRVEYAILALYFIFIGIGESYMINISFNISLLLLLEHGIEKFSVFDIRNYIKNGRIITWKKQV